jgi:hypothetical protein
VFGSTSMRVIDNQTLVSIVVISIKKALPLHKINVAISRARCLAILLASPGLLDLVANSVDEMRLTNLFCWAAEFAGGGRSEFL